MDREEVRLGDGLIERQEFDAHVPCLVGGHVRVVGDHMHPERPGPIGDELADATEADHRQRLVGQFDTLPTRTFPAASRQRRVRLGDVAGLSQQQRHRVLGGRDDVALRCVDHHDPTTGRRLDIDVVEPDAGATDDEQLVGVLQNLGGDLRRGSNDEALRTDDVVEQRIQIELDIDLVAGSAQTVEPAFGDFFGDEDSCHCTHRYRRNRGFEKN